MTGSGQNLYLYGYLEHLTPYLSRPDVTDVYINQPEEIWVETRGQGAVMFAAPSLTRDTLFGLVQQVAAFSAQGISREHPVLSASLPTGERIQVIVPPATRGDVAIAIRRHAAAALTLNDFFSAAASVPEASDNHLSAEACKPVTHLAAASGMLAHAVRSRKNIIVSGGTSSGKTTFLNALIAVIPKAERLLFIEDTPELQFEHRNAVGLIAARGSLREAQVDTNDLLTASLRMRPDRIILGELRGDEAVTFLRAINTGHPGSMTTIHADTAESAFEQLAFLALQAGLRLEWHQLLDYIKSTIDISVHLDRGNRMPVVQDLRARE